MLIKLIYAGFVGLFTVFVIGVGIATFYEEPVYPEYPSGLKLVTDQPTEEQIAIQEQYDQEMAAFDEINETYSRDVALITLGLAVFVLAIGVTFAEKLGVISEGLLFGGMFTLFYGVIVGFASGDSVARFMIMLIALAVALGFGYWKFVLPTQKNTVKK